MSANVTLPKAIHAALEQEPPMLVYEEDEHFLAVFNKGQSTEKLRDALARLEERVGLEDYSFAAATEGNIDGRPVLLIKTSFTDLREERKDAIEKAAERLHRKDAEAARNAIEERQEEVLDTAGKKFQAVADAMEKAGAKRLPMDESIDCWEIVCDRGDDTALTAKITNDLQQHFVPKEQQKFPGF